MHRFLLTGTLALSLSAAGAFAPFAASAADTVAITTVPNVMSVPVVTAPEGGPVSPAAVAAAKARLAALESKAPTAGADLAMWGASRSASSNEDEQVAASASPADVPSAVNRFASGILARSASIAMALTRNAMRFLGTPYAFGGTTAGGFDCSGYVQHVFAMLGLHVPRTADAQYAAAHRILGAMRPGDLVFFQTYERGASHVGIYLGHDRFIHSSSSHGVVVSSLQDRYWSARYLGAKRVVN